MQAALSPQQRFLRYDTPLCASAGLLTFAYLQAGGHPESQAFDQFNKLLNTRASLLAKLDIPLLLLRKEPQNYVHWWAVKKALEEGQTQALPTLLNKATQGASAIGGLTPITQSIQRFTHQFETLLRTPALRDPLMQLPALRKAVPAVITEAHAFFEHLFRQHALQNNASYWKQLAQNLQKIKLLNAWLWAGIVGLGSFGLMGERRHHQHITQQQHLRHV